MAKPTIECPRCKGRIGTVFRDQSLDDALERHERLTHAPPPKVKEPPAAEVVPPASKVVRRRR